MPALDTPPSPTRMIKALARERLQVLSCQRHTLAVNPPLRNARGSCDTRTILVLHLQAAGHAGYGEASPLPDYSPDNLDGCERALLAIPVAQLAALEALRTPAELLAAAARLVPEALPAARFALETALLDRLGQLLQRPLWSLLHALDPATSTPHSSPVELCALLDSGDPERALADAERHCRAGIHTFKLKIGPDILQPEQRATLSLLRGALGQSIQLRLDANRSLSRAVLSDTLRQLTAYDPEYVEEPVADPRPEDFANSPCGLALDESLQALDERSIVGFLSFPSCRALVLKPSALGGLSRCMQLASLARRHGRDSVVSHALEGPLGWLACAHLAVALAPRAAAGLWPLAHQAKSARLVLRGGKLHAPRAAGLGAAA
jgi:o-succinylbenzoate synthase